MGAVRAALSIGAGWLAMAVVGCAQIGAPDATAGAEVDGGASGPALGDAGVASDGAPSEACIDGWSERLANADFDQGPDIAWTATADIIRREADLPIHVDSGEYAAVLGARNDLDATLSQPVRIPAAATQLRLSARTCFVTAESSGSADKVGVVLRDASGTVVTPLREFSNQDAHDICNWASLDVAVAPAPAGQDLTFEMHVTTNSSVYTSFYFDTLALEALSDCGQ